MRSPTEIVVGTRLRKIDHLPYHDHGQPGTYRVVSDIEVVQILGDRIAEWRTVRVIEESGRPSWVQDGDALKVGGGFSIAAYRELWRQGKGQDLQPLPQPEVASRSYVGYARLGQDEDAYQVVVETGDRSAYPLDPRLDLANHSPTGFCWGYYGSGPAQLALAILADYLGDDQRARLLYQDYKNDVIARIPMGDNFTLTGREVDDWITRAALRFMRADQPVASRRRP